MIIIAIAKKWLLLSIKEKEEEWKQEKKEMKNRNNIHKSVAS
jgi:hypothetical protein